jgi:hypothetical protein
MKKFFSWIDFVTKWLLSPWLLIIVIDSSFVEQVEEPVIYLSLYYTDSCILQYKIDKSSYSSLNRIFIDEWLVISQNVLFVIASI